MLESGSELIPSPGDAEEPRNRVSQVDDPITLPSIKITTTPGALYEATLRGMHAATVGRGTPEIYTLKSHAEFFGQLLNHPATFEMAAAKLEEIYAAAVPDETGAYRAVEREIVKQMGKHPMLRQRAIEIALSPKGYGMSAQPERHDGLEDVRALMQGVADRDPAPSADPVRLALHGVAALKNLYVSALLNISAGAQSRSGAARDLDQIYIVKELILDVVESIGNNDPKLSNKLLDIFEVLERWWIEGKKARGQIGESYISQDISKMVEFQELRPRLAQIVKHVRDVKEQGNAYFCLYRAYAEDGQFDLALDMLSQARDISHVVYNSAFSKTSASQPMRNRTLTEIRRIGGDQEVARLVVVANAAFEHGAVAEAQDIFTEAWNKSRLLEISGLLEDFVNHDRHIAQSFIDAARKLGREFDGMGAEEMLEAMRKKAHAELLALEPSSRVHPWVAQFADLVVLELSKSGLYEQAEELVTLIDKKSRIEYWGADAARMRPEERDKAYMQMAVGAAHRQDYQRIEDCLTKMGEFRPDAMHAVTNILARQGAFESSFVASALSAQQIVHADGIPQDRGEIGLTTRFLPIDQGEALLDLGKAMLEKGVDLERVGKVFKLAARVGLGSKTLQRLVDTVKQHAELQPLIVELLAEGLHNNRALIQQEQHAVILQALREFFPQLNEFDLDRL